MITKYIFYKYFLPTLCSNMRSVFGSAICSLFGIILENIAYLIDNLMFSLDFYCSLFFVLKNKKE